MKSFAWAIGLLVIHGVAASQDLKHCAGIEDAVQRLACYDRLAGRVSSSPQPVSAIPTPLEPAARPVAPPRPAGEFGLPQASAGRVTEVRSHVVGLLDSWDANTVFVLANGQHWRVADGSSAYLNLQAPEVRIREAALGGYMMEIAGSNRMVRVRRVR